MSRRFDPSPVVVVYADGSSYPDGATAAPIRETGHKSGQKYRPAILSEQNSGDYSAVAAPAALPRRAVTPVASPYDLHREFPLRWRAYIRGNFRGLAHVQQVFGVSERTARNWWNGTTGVNGGHVAIAVNQHPIAATQMLFAAE